MRKIFILVVAMLIITAINFKIYQTEHFIKYGKSVYFKLAPVDPRSLMQGDYMALRYDIERGLYSSNTKGKTKILLTLDKKRVAKIKSLSDTAKLGKDEFLVSLNKKPYRVELKLAHRYYFQEGKSKKYEKAVYGKFKTDSSKMILVNLVDKDFKDL